MSRTAIIYRSGKWLLGATGDTRGHSDPWILFSVTAFISAVAVLGGLSYNIFAPAWIPPEAWFAMFILAGFFLLWVPISGIGD